MKTIGTLQYFTNWLVAWVDPQIGEYYRALIPKYLYVAPPMYPSHISIVRLFEKPKKDLWKKYEGEQVEIDYNLPVKTDGTYFWLDAYSSRIEEIRIELGLPRYLGDFTCQHITVGNLKCQTEEKLEK